MSVIHSIDQSTVIYNYNLVFGCVIGEDKSSPEGSSPGDADSQQTGAERCCGEGRIKGSQRGWKSL